MGNTNSGLAFTPNDELTNSFLNPHLQPWKAFNGVAKKDGSAVAIFSVDKTQAAASHIALAQNCVKKIKTLKHPFVLRVLESAENDAGIHLVTESCTPLCAWLEQSKGSDAFENALLWGLYGMLTGLAFLHKNGISHGSLSVDSIFVTATGDWKLAGFGNTASTQQAGFSVGGWRDAYMACTSSTFRAPFLDAAVDMQQLSAVDMWGAAVVTAAVFSQGSFDTVFKASPDSLRRISLGFVPESLRSTVHSVLSSSQQPPRATPQTLLGAAHFKHPMVGALLFLDSLALKEAAQKQKFFKALPSLLPRLPPGVRTGKVLPALMNALEYGAAGGGGTVVLAPILNIGKELPKEEYASKIVPCVVRLFASPDRATRIQLLHHMPEYVHALPAATLNADVFTHTMAGFADTQPLLREATVKAASCMAPQLSSSNLNTVLVRALAKCMVDTVPSIRVNSVIAICTMAPHLDAASRDAVLCRFLGKALTDTLPAARKATLTAMQHCVEKKHVSNKAIAGTLLAAAARQCLSTSGEVASQAVRTVQACVQRLAQHAQATVDAAPSPTAAETHVPTAREHSAAAASAAPAVASAAASSAAAPPRSSAPAPAPVKQSRQPSAAQSSASFAKAPAARAAAQPAAAPAPAAGGTDWDEFDLDISEAPGVAVAPTQAFSSSGFGAIPAPPIQSATDADGWGDDGWPEDDDAPAEPAPAPAPKPAPNTFSLKGKATRLSAAPAVAAAADDGWDDW